MLAILASVRAEAVRIPAGPVLLDGDYTQPAATRGVVLFAHGSGSSRHSPRNRYVATALNRVEFGTVLMDLLTADEDELDRRTGALRFDIALLAQRLTAAADWLAATSRAAPPPLFLFGASTGAAAALRCAADRPELVNGVVSRGGRPDLAAEALHAVRAPTLLIVGGNDPLVRDLNEQAAATISAGVEVVVIPGATHLFEEPGALDAVIDATIERLRRWQAA
jgi:pimeloyl-ACP methyl ester carboxylesterase